MELSEDCLPFFHSLKENTIRGTAYASIFGANTPNSEYEFLTGNTMGFLPPSSVGFHLFVRGAMPSLASELKNAGYDTLAIHPYRGTNYRRNIVYPQIGFDKYYARVNFTSPEYVRNYISDQELVDRIISEYEKHNQKTDAPLFSYNVTMQNHGGYSRESPDFDIYLTLPQVSPKTLSVTSTEKYLTLMNLSDQALEDLTSRFAQEEEPTIILMLGDHQPSDYITNVVRRITGTTDDPSIDETQTGYRVPFVIWSNYGLEHKYYDGISVNYLGGILMEAAGIPLTGYQQFLSGLMEQLPVINANGLRGADGVFHDYSQDSAYEELLNDYKILQYNDLIDDGHRDDSFYG